MINQNRLELLKYNPDLITRDEVVDLVSGRQRTRTRWAVGFGVFAEILAYLILGCVLDVFTIWPLAVIVVAIFLARLAARLVRLNKEGQI